MNAPWRVCNPSAANSESLTVCMAHCFVSLSALKRGEGKRADLSRPRLRLERQAAHRKHMALRHGSLSAVAHVRGKAIKITQGLLAAIDVARAAMVGQEQVVGAGAAFDI